MNIKSIMSIESTDMDEYRDWLTDQAAARFMAGQFTYVECEGKKIDATVVKDLNGKNLVMLGDMVKIWPTI